MRAIAFAFVSACWLYAFLCLFAGGASRRGYPWYLLDFHEKALAVVACVALAIVAAFLTMYAIVKIFG